MMKKLLALILVLGMASLASAGLSLVGPIEMMPSDTIMIMVTSDQPVTGGIGVGVGLAVGGPGSWTGVAVPAPGDRPDPAGSGNEIAYYGDVTEILGLPLDLWLVTLTAPRVAPYPEGDWVAFEFHCDGPGDVVIQLLDGTSFEVLDTLIIHQVPEPASLALLGLGGLFLRRRK